MHCCYGEVLTVFVLVVIWGPKYIGTDLVISMEVGFCLFMSIII